MKATPRVIRRIIDTVKPLQRICVVGHMRPDGDCIGSQLGLALALINAGKDVVCWNQDPVPPKLRFLDSHHIFERPRPGRSFDAVIATDSASYERLGAVCEHITERQVLINIDHHASNTRFGDLNWVAAREPACGTLVFRLLKEAGWPVTEPIADCLFTAISTDTGSFQYPTTRPATYHVAAELVKRGANLAVISNQVYNSYPLSRMKLLGHVFNSFRLQHNDEIAYFWLRREDYERTGATVEDTEGLIDHIRAIEPVIVACVFEEIEPRITRISLRSKSDVVDVNAIASRFGGGGHRAAAGARIEGDPATVQRDVLGAIKEALDATPA
jgi:phosphoesterase RecJ-like protein